MGQTSETGSFAIKVDHRLEHDASMPEDYYLHYNRYHSLWETISMACPTIHHKPILFLGLIVCVLSGAMTPLPSSLLSRLLYEVFTGANNRTHEPFWPVAPGVASLDGLFLGLKYLIVESCGTAWIAQFRKRVLTLVLRQDQAWFDKAEHSAARLVQAIVKDADNPQSLVAVVLGKCIVVAGMFGVGLVWAVVGDGSWRLLGSQSFRCSEG